MTTRWTRICILMLTTFRPPDPIKMPHIEKSEYDKIREANIKERDMEFLRIFGYPNNGE